MCICYVWIEEFRNLRNFGINLSGTHKFHFDVSTKTVTSIEVDQLPTSFFYDDIVDVIGIIGKNGAGKSNILELLCKILTGSKSTVNSNFFLITQQNEQFIFHSSLNEEFKDVGLLPGMLLVPYAGELNPLKVIYFSNVFDNRQIDFPSGVSDISLNSRHYSRIYNLNRGSELRQQLDLIQSKLFSNLGLDTPQYFEVSFKIWSRNSANSSQIRINKIAARSQEVKKLIREKIRSIKGADRFVYLLKSTFFLSKLEEIDQFQKIVEDENFNDKLSTLVASLYSQNIEQVCMSLMVFLVDEVFAKFDPVLVHYQKIGSRRLSTQKELDNQMAFIMNTKIQYISVNYSSEGSRTKLLEYYQIPFMVDGNRDFVGQFVDLFGHDSYFDMSWLGISSGQKAYLNLFASIFSELRRGKFENVILCIDEGDLYLHPKWQIEFFDKLTWFLSKAFKFQIQLVLTSHSPFLVADLPNQHLSILEEGKSVDGITLPVKTFGGNLYNLYSDTFFLGGRRTSEFASKKISPIVEALGKKILTKEDRSFLDSMLNIVGDDILRYRIAKALAE